MKLIKFKKGMTVYLIPIRYWESEYPIKPLTVIETCSMDDTAVLARDPDESCSMYYGIRNFIFYRLENAKRARELMTELHELENNDGTDVWCDIVMLK